MIKFFLNSFFWKVLNIVAALFTGILLARILTIDDRGEYAIFISVISLYTVILNFGIPESLVYLLQKEKQKISLLVKYGLIIPLAILFVLILVYFSCVFYNINIFFLEDKNMLIPIFICLIFGSYNVLLRHLFLKDNKIPEYNLLSSLETISNLVVFFILFITDNFSLLNLVYVFTANILLSFTIHVNFLKKSLNLFFKEKFIFDYKVFKKLIKLSIPLFFLGLSAIFSNRLNIFILDYFHDSKSVGYFAIAIILPNLLMIMPNQISVLLYPVASAIEDEIDLINYGKKILRHVIFFTILIVILGLIIVPFLIPFFYGYQYAVVIPTAYILLAGVLFGGINSVLVNLLISHGQSNILIYNALTIIFGVLLLSFLVYLYSYIGTAITFTIVNILCFYISFLKYKKITKINLSSLIISMHDITSLQERIYNLLKK